MRLLMFGTQAFVFASLFFGTLTEAIFVQLHMVDSIGLPYFLLCSMVFSLQWAVVLAGYCLLKKIAMRFLTFSSSFGTRTFVFASLFLGILTEAIFESGGLPYFLLCFMVFSLGWAVVLTGCCLIAKNLHKWLKGSAED